MCRIGIAGAGDGVMPKYSFIFCYRNRETHLNIVVPRIRTLYLDAEIIIVEQNDTKKFRRANLLNEGAKSASGDILVVHDIDYYPHDAVEYYDDRSDVFLPVRRVVFCYNDLTPKPLEEVPGGYRHFKVGVDADFFGGVTTFTKDAFFAINGFSPLYVGWGFEDADLRERIKHYRLSVQRSANNMFSALDHPDSGPTFQDQDFINNIHMSQQWARHLDIGVKNQPSHIENITPKHPMVDKWLLASEFDIVPKTHMIIATPFDFGEGEE
jgi:glycosyl transferase family 7 (putative galactosyltransferase)